MIGLLIPFKPRVRIILGVTLVEVLILTSVVVAMVADVWVGLFAVLVGNYPQFPLKRIEKKY